MAEIFDTPARTQTTISDMEHGGAGGDSPRPFISIFLIQKLMGEFVGTFCLVFAGCSAIVVNDMDGKPVTLPGIALTWGLTVMVMTYSIGHVSGAHFNPAISIALASTRKFPFKQLPGYIVAQVLGAALAVDSVRLVFHLDESGCSLKGSVYVGSHPSSTKTAAFVMEFIATFNLLFVISAVATDKRANRAFAGLAIGATVVLDILFSGPVSGASMNPARSLAPAFIWSCYKDLWVYIVAPIIGGVAGAWTYGILRSTNKSFGEILRPNFNKISSKDRQEGSQDDICLLRTVDPNNRKIFICSSPTDIDNNCYVKCKLP